MILKSIIFSWRNIQKNSTYSIINITGLSLAIAVVVLILFWVTDELNFDKFHKNLNRIYTVYEHQQYSGGQELYTNCTPFPLNQELVKKYPEVENATTYTRLGDQMVKFEDKEYKIDRVYSADNNFLKIFSYEILEGDINALSSTDRIIITDDFAKLFFGNKTAIGKVFKFNNKYSLTVGAVIAEQHANSTINFKVIVPNEFLKTQGAELSQWGNNWPNTSILLAAGANTKNLNTKIANICKNNGQSNTTLHLFPYKNEHLYSYSGKNNRIQYLYQFLAIAFIIILIASINFINLSLTKAEQRSMEIGVRKVQGASKTNIIWQFVIEKGMMILISIILSGILVALFLSEFRTISDKNIIIDWQNKNLILMLLTTFFIILGLSAVYPAIYHSSINTVHALKKTKKVTGKNISLKSMLVVFQFIMAIVLISGSIIVSQQIKYISNYDLGYNHGNLVYLPLRGDAKNKHEAIKQELTAISGVKAITCSDKLPFYGGNSSWGHDWEGKDPQNEVLICKMNVDNNYFKTMGIKLVDGSNFPEAYNKVLKEEEIISPQVILNQEAIKRMDIKKPVGKYFSPWGDKKGTIIGVVEDFHFESLHQGIEPLLLLPLLYDPEYVILRVSPDNFSQTIDNIKKSYLKVMPKSTCDIDFFDDQLAKLYHSEEKISGLFGWFTFIAIFISCIGLFGLSLNIIERRRKEVGVRKVNGARVSEVMILLNIDFIKWVVIAFLIAYPISYYVMNKWLQNFAFKTKLSWWVFILAGSIALIIALLTVCLQSYRAATRNPVEALRYE